MCRNLTLGGSIPYREVSKHFEMKGSIKSGHSLIGNLIVCGVIRDKYEHSRLDPWSTF